MNRNNNTRSDKEVCFFGDSFSRLFGLIKHNKVDLNSYKGATAKGLTRVDNPNRKSITRTLSQRPNATRIVFTFGNVDVHLSYFYNKYKEKDPVCIDLVQIAEDYVDFVSSCVVPKGAEVIVVGVYPSAPTEDVLQASLVSYGTLTKEQADRMDQEDRSILTRQNRVVLFNKVLAERCAELGITYADTVSEMIDPGLGTLLAAYKDVSDHNIHVVWETTVLLWMKKWPWYGRLAPPGFEKDLRRTLDEYLRTKPWAEKKHVTEKMGIREAVEEKGRWPGRKDVPKNDSPWRSEKQQHNRNERPYKAQRPYRAENTNRDEQPYREEKQNGLGRRWQPPQTGHWHEYRKREVR